jgi:hypothetical protein
MSRGKEITLSIGTSLDDLSPVAVTPEALFGRHCAIVGSSGSGKSWTVARIVEESAKHRAKLILFDPSGEFESLHSNIFHTHIGISTRPEDTSIAASVPYYELSEPDLIEIFRPTNATQWIKLRAAIKTLKLLHLVPGMASNGTLSKAQKLKSPFEQALAARSAQIDRPESIFNIHKLALQIELECIDPVRSSTELQYWGGHNREDHTACVPLINRIEEVLRTPELNTIFHPTPGPSAFEALEKLITDQNVAVLRVSLEFLPTTHRVREIVVNALARHVLQLGRNGVLARRPVVVVVDEAHQVFPPQSQSEDRAASVDAFHIIAKEGRKYGITLCLATQRPRDIPDDVLSQVGTFLVHRLIGSTDRASIEMASGSLDAAGLASLATLGPGEALLLGAGIRDARRIKVLPPITTPVSYGPDYQRSWKRLPTKT